eukprot:1291463-Pyramimonas_sp.AAC.1
MVSKHGWRYPVPQPLQQAATTRSYIDAHSAIDYIEDDTSAIAPWDAMGGVHPRQLSALCTPTTL